MPTPKQLRRAEHDAARSVKLIQMIGSRALALHSIKTMLECTGRAAARSIADLRASKQLYISGYQRTSRNTPLYRAGNRRDAVLEAPIISALEMRAAAVVALLKNNNLTRAQISAAIGCSNPSAYYAIQHLKRAGKVQIAGFVHVGRRGREEEIYSLTENQ